MCYHENTDFPGNDIYDITDVSSYEDCNESCNDYIHCRSWTWSEHDKKCWLKNKLYDTEKDVERTDFVSGGLNCKGKTSKGKSRLSLISF